MHQKKMYFQRKFTFCKYFNSPQRQTLNQLNCSLFAVGSALFVPVCLWRPDARIASPYGKAAGAFEAEIFELQLKWQSKHITSNVVRHKYGIRMHCLKHRAAGI